MNSVIFFKFKLKDVTITCPLGHVESHIAD